MKAPDRHGAIEARRELLQSLRPLGLEAWAECEQMHGDSIVDNPLPAVLDCNPGLLPKADGMMTDKPGLGLLIKTADCQPILLAHKSGAQIMAIHSGWRGNRMDFPGTAVKAFCARHNARPDDIMAVRGPSLGPAAAEFVNFDQEWGAEWRRWFCEKTKCLDMWAMARHQLRQAGVPDGQIYQLDICTCLNTGDFFSWRRDKTPGRQASIIWIENSLA